jgi:hypothetical protein
VDASGTALPRPSGILLSQTQLVELAERGRRNGDNAAGSITPSQVAGRGGTPYLFSHRLGVSELARVEHGLEQRGADRLPDVLAERPRSPLRLPDHLAREGRRLSVSHKASQEQKAKELVDGCSRLIREIGMLSPRSAKLLTAGPNAIQPPFARRAFEYIGRPDELGQPGGSGR